MICFIEECPLKARTLSLCEKHNAQIKKHGHIFNEDELAQMRKEKHANRRQPSGWTWPEESKKALSSKFKGRRLNSGRTHFTKGFKSWNSGLKDWMSDEHKKAIIQANTKYTDFENLTNKQLRSKFRTTRRAVIKRDGGMCIECGAKEHLQVDHIKQWSQKPHLRFALENCRTLCMNCHYYTTYKKKLPQGNLWGHNIKETSA